jgi:hypothetical protein
MLRIWLPSPDNVDNEFLAFHRSKQGGRGSEAENDTNGYSFRHSVGPFN